MELNSSLIDWDTVLVVDGESHPFDIFRDCVHHIASLSLPAHESIVKPSSKLEVHHNYLTGFIAAHFALVVTTIDICIWQSYREINTVTITFAFH